MGWKSDLIYTFIPAWTPVGIDPWPWAHCQPGLSDDQAGSSGWQCLFPVFVIPYTQTSDTHPLPHSAIPTQYATYSPEFHALQCVPQT